LSAVSLCVFVPLQVRLCAALSSTNTVAFTCPAVLTVTPRYHPGCVAHAAWHPLDQSRQRCACNYSTPRGRSVPPRRSGNPSARASVTVLRSLRRAARAHRRFPHLRNRTTALLCSAFRKARARRQPRLTAASCLATARTTLRGECCCRFEPHDVHVCLDIMMLVCDGCNCLLTPSRCLHRLTTPAATGSAQIASQLDCSTPNRTSVLDRTTQNSHVYDLLWTDTSGGRGASAECQHPSAQPSERAAGLRIHHATSQRRIAKLRRAQDTCLVPPGTLERAPPVPPPRHGHCGRQAWLLTRT
jgi:hypothetical protein